jgi:hypothetical protein
MFRLITTVRKGAGRTLPAVRARYDSLESARAAAAMLLRHERIGNIMIVRDDLQPEFVEWRSR